LTKTKTLFKYVQTNYYELKMVYTMIKILKAEHTEALQTETKTKTDNQFKIKKFLKKGRSLVRGVLK